jgi:hypothetical protein
VNARAAWADSGGFALAQLGIPLACASLGLVAESRGGTAAPAVLVVVGLLSLAWSLLTALGLGLPLLVPSLLLLLAAAPSWDHRNAAGTRGAPAPGE